MASVDFMKTTFSILIINIYFLPLTKTMYNKMKNNKYHTVGTIPKSKIKIAYRGKNRYL